MLTDANSETFKKLNKMNTDRLISVFVSKFNAYPNTFDRSEILQQIKDKFNEEFAERLQNRAADEMATLARNNKIIFGNMQAKIENREEGNIMKDGDIIAIRALYEDGNSYAKIGKMFNKQPNYIRNIVIRKLYKNVN